MQSNYKELGLKMSSSTLIMFLSSFCFLLKATISMQPDCNRNCTLRNNVIIEICLFKDGDMKYFSSCCTECKWVDFQNVSHGNFFVWNSESHSYGQYNCTNESEVAVRRIMVIPKSKLATV